MRRFADRSDAGRRLAHALEDYRRRRPVILALPRGGVPVAAEVAKAFDAPLDLLLVRKIGVPMQPELAMGAVVDGTAPIVVRNDDVIDLVGVSDDEFDAVCREQLVEIERRRARYIGSRPRAEVTGRVVIVIDDGIATGATMRAALRATRQRAPQELVLAVPVAPAETIDDLRREVDAAICLETPRPFGAIGAFYEDFRQVSDDEVIADLARLPATRSVAVNEVARMYPAASPLLTDLYQLNMLQAYLEHGRTGTAVFEFFVRRLPARRGFLVAAGLEQVLDHLAALRFAADELEWLRRSGRFGSALIDYLAGFRFTGDVDAMPEGTVFFADEPILRVTAPLPEAQLAETRLVNILHFQSLVAAKAARMVLAAPGKPLIDFGLRRAHGAEAGIMAARASYLAGFAGTATVLAGKEFSIPIFGTMAHSFVQVHDDETAAFEAFARSRPDDLVLLIDTYDTEAAARKVVRLASRLKAQGISVRGVRLDSGDLIGLSGSVRRILDEGGLADVTIFASGGLDEDALARIVAAGAPIDGFGIGTSLTTSSDVPALDCAYKLQEYAGIARRKRSAGKATLPGRKQVWRRFDDRDRMTDDVLSTADDRQRGTPLLQPVMRDGRRLAPSPPLAEVRRRAAAGLAQLPGALRRLEGTPAYPVAVGSKLVALTEQVDRDHAARERALA
ncbi:MAG: nicotinate phosphoribosyltransferase [Alphaproteobacteria bacterium]|nr:nicotinate phosphoribosyltransferase [Alphaproteobacteria bacterium]